MPKSQNSDAVTVFLSIRTTNVYKYKVFKCRFLQQLSDGLTLSWHELNAIVLYLATDRQT